MTNERSKGGSGNGHGGGDGVDDFGDSEEPTVVIVSDEYTRRAIVKLAGGLRGSADRCDRYGALGGEADSETEAVGALEELVESLGDLVVLAQAAERGAARHLRERIAAANKRKQAKERP